VAAVSPPRVGRPMLLPTPLRSPWPPGSRPASSTSVPDRGSGVARHRPHVPGGESWCTAFEEHSTKDGVAGSMPAEGSTHRLTSGNAGQLGVWGPVERGDAGRLGVRGGVGTGACRMESTSLVNRSGSGRARPKTLPSLRHTRCDKGPVPFWPLNARVRGMVRRGGRRGRRGRGGAGRLIPAGGASGRSGWCGLRRCVR
jgi:hypothetical protein